MAVAVALAVGAGCASPPPSLTVTQDGGVDAGAPAVDTGTPGGDAGAAEVGADPQITLGEMETLLADGALGLGYFPDEGTSLIADSPVRLLVTDGLSKSTFVLEAAAGASDPLKNLSSKSQVFGPGPAGSFDNGYAGASGLYRHSDGTLYAFYHAEDQEGLGTLPGTNISGFYARIGVAYSGDGGATWTKGGYVIESFVPKRVPDGVTIQADQGAAEPGAVVSPDGRYLYLYYTEHSRSDGAGGSRPVAICMARADLAAWPPAFPSPPGPLRGVFTKYHAGSFSTDGIGGIDSPVVAPPTASSNSLEGHVAYSARFGKLVMIYGVDAWGERAASPARADVSGLYAAFSDDGIVWRRSAAPLIRDFGVAQPGLSVSWEASVVWDAGSDSTGWLVYGYSPSFGSPGHYMVGRRLTLSASPSP
jgi:hypothetical protein